MQEKGAEENARQKQTESLRQQLGLHRLPAVLLAAGIIALSATVTGIGVAALIFTGPLQPFLFAGIGVVLFGTTVTMFVLALTSSAPGIIGVPQEVPAVILGLMGTAIFSALVPVMEPAQAVTVVLAAIALATVISAACFLFLGVLRLGAIIRFLPFSLVGGVLAAMGWLLVQGGVTVLVGEPLSFSGLSALITGDSLLRLGGGLLVGIALLLMTRWSGHYAVVPSVLATAILVFYGVTTIVGITPAEAQADAWLLGPFPEQGAWQWPQWSSLAAVDRSLLFELIPILATLLLASVISLLLHASGLELEMQCDLDLNRELRASGLANLFTGAAGGAIGFHSMSDSMLARTMNASYRLTGMLAALILAGLLTAGFSLLAWFPRPVLGGLLLFLGLSLLLNWVVAGYRRLPLGDWLVVLLIVVVAGTVGFLVSIGVGLIASIIAFTINYSRVPVARHALTGEDLHSNVERSPEQRELIRQKGAAVQVLVLQNYIFFGTAHNMLETVKSRLADTHQPPLRYLILDLARVTGLDTASVTTFRKLAQLARARGFEVVLTALRASDRRLLIASGLDPSREEGVRVESSLDHGLEYAERGLLGQDERPPGATTLSAAFPDLEHAEAIAEYAEPFNIEAGGVLILQGDPSDDLYIILQGSVTILDQGPDVDDRRLRKYGSGTLVGELAFYLETARTATVKAESPAHGLRLTRAAIQRMRRNDPELAAALHHWIASGLAERLASGSRLLSRLS